MKNREIIQDKFFGIISTTHAIIFITTRNNWQYLNYAKYAYRFKGSKKIKIFRSTYFSILTS